MRCQALRTVVITVCICFAVPLASDAAEIFVSQQKGHLDFRRVKLKQNKKGSYIAGQLYSKHYKRVGSGSHMHIYVYDSGGTLLEQQFESTARRVFHQKDSDKRKRGYMFPGTRIALESSFGEIALVKIYVYGQKHYEYEAYDE